jgi:hypothetical protein
MAWESSTTIAGTCIDRWCDSTKHPTIVRHLEINLSHTTQVKQDLHMDGIALTKFGSTLFDCLVDLYIKQKIVTLQFYGH